MKSQEIIFIIWKMLTFSCVVQKTLNELMVVYWDTVFLGRPPSVVYSTCFFIIPFIGCFVWRLVWYMAFDIIMLIDWLKMCNCFPKEKVYLEVQWALCTASILELMNTTLFWDTHTLDNPVVLIDGYRLNNHPITHSMKALLSYFICPEEWT